MCAIYSTWGGAECEVRSFIDRNINLLGRRGSDDYDLKLFEPDEAPTLWMGHQRLAITGGVTSIQPVQAGRFSFIFNGEIFGAFGKEGVATKIRLLGDVEYLRYFFQSVRDAFDVEAFCNGLSGFFAFVIYDHLEHKLHLIRDRYGQKPLYFRASATELLASSYATAFFGVGTEIAPASEWPGGGFRFDEDKPASDVLQVPKGHFITFQWNGVEFLKDQRRWYKPKTRPIKNIGFNQQCKLFEQKLIRAVENRSYKEGEFGASLSGGMDSLLVADILTKDLGFKFPVFTLGQENERYDETAVVVQRARSLGLDLNIIKPTKMTLNDTRKAMELVEFQSFNLSFPGYQNYYNAVSKAGIKVLYEGHGADEYLGGYPACLLASAAYDLLHGKFSSLALKLKNLQKLNVSALSFFSSLYRGLLKGDRRHLSGRLQTDFFFNSGSLPVVLRIVDRLSMAAGVEVRCPFLDHELVEFGQGLPESSLFYGGRTKAILLQILASRGYKKSEFELKVGFTSDFHFLASEIFPSTRFTSKDEARAFIVSRQHQIMYKLAQEFASAQGKAHG